MPTESSLDVGGHAARVLRAGEGPIPAVFFAGIGGVPQWTPFLEALSETRPVIVPSLPGFPGAEDFRHLDTLFDWVVHSLEVLEGLDLDSFDLIGSSVGGALAAEVAALMADKVRRLVLVAPFGVYDVADPAADIWAQVPGPDSIPTLVCQHPERWKSAWERPEGADEVEWSILQTRSMEAAARFLFPFGATGIERRLHRLCQPTLLVRGVHDRVLPASYLERFAQGIAGEVRQAVIDDAGHLAELDQPDALCREINAFLSDQRG